MAPLLAVTTRSRSTRLVAAVLTGGLLLCGCAANTAQDPAPPEPPASEAPNEQEPDAPPEQEEPAEVEEPAGAEQPESNGAPSQTAILTVGDETFTFTLGTCMITPQDVLVEGGGKNDATGELAFLSVDLVVEDTTTGEARIELGTDQVFDTSEDFYVAFFGDSDQSTVAAAYPNISLTGEFKFRGEESVGAGQLNANCS